MLISRRKAAFHDYRSLHLKFQMNHPLVQPKKNSVGLPLSMQITLLTCTIFLISTASLLHADEREELLMEREKILLEREQKLKDWEQQIIEREKKLGEASPRPVTSQAEPAEKKVTLPRSHASKAINGYLDFNAYYDTQALGVFTINALANLPNQFQYFSLTNYTNNPEDKLADLQNFFTEQNLRWAIPNDIPFDLTTQWVTRSGTKNDLLRFGTRWRARETPWIGEILKKINFNYTLNFHIFEINEQSGYQWQMEHVYRLDIFQIVWITVCIFQVSRIIT